MKLHRNLVEAVVKGLLQIFSNQQQADLTIQHLLMNNKSWGARDRDFIASNIYHIVRYKRLYEFAANTQLTDEASTWLIIGARFIRAGIQLPPYKEWESLELTQVTERLQEGSKWRAVRESVPDWLDKLGEEQLGEQWEKELAALNTEAALCLRVNTLKITVANAKTLLERQGIAFTETPLAPEALVLSERKNLRQLEAYKQGWLEVQDVSSQRVAPKLQLQSGMCVIDACAGAGGKTLHIAALLQNKGKIIAVDTVSEKLKELHRRAVKAGCTIVHTMLSEELFAQKETYHHRADALLLDVPCSGTGVLRRKPDAKWRLTPTFLTQVTETQQQLLESHIPFLKPGGMLVYSTCSLLPQENEQQIQRFLQQHQGEFTLVSEERISPAQSGFDGFYIAALRKNG